MSALGRSIDARQQALPLLWRWMPVEDPRAAELADRHYSRQTPGARGVLPPGQRFLLWHDGPKGGALWGVVRNVFRDVWRWRNSIFRNESGTLSSTLIRAATTSTREFWVRRYGALPPEPLITEVDALATAGRRSRAAVPGVCYQHAGWILERVTPRAHGRPERYVWRAP